jgi:DNA-binding CsgD family transcriptional regulator
MGVTTRRVGDSTAFTAVGVVRLARDDDWADGGARRAVMTAAAERVRTALRPEDVVWTTSDEVWFRASKVASPQLAEQIGWRVLSALADGPGSGALVRATIGVALGGPGVSEEALRRRAAAAAQPGPGDQRVNVVWDGAPGPHQAAQPGRPAAPAPRVVAAGPVPRRQPRWARPLPFVGRAKELESLLGALDQARSGTGCLIVIEGDPGVGKSCLVAAFLEQAGPALVLWAGADQEEASLSYGVLSQLAMTGPALPLAVRPVIPPAGADSDPFSVGVGFLQALGEAGGPVVLVVDDAHFADRQSLAVLRFVSRRLADQSALVVVVVRQARSLGEPWQRLLAEPYARLIRLEGLEPTELLGLGRALGVASLSPAGASRLFDHTGGNPLHARQLLEQLPPDALNRPGGLLPAPRDLAGAITARLGSLSLSARELLAAAAVLGSRCRLADAVALAGIPTGTEALVEAEGAGLAAAGEAEDGSVEVVFSHQLVHAAVYHDLAPARRRALHAGAAEVLGADQGLSHRVAAAVGPEEELAAELERAAAEEAGAGRASLAAAHLSDALRLSRPGPARVRRLLGTVEALLVGGEAAAAAGHEPELAALAPDAWVDYVAGYLSLVLARVPEAEARLARSWSALSTGTPPPAGAPADLRARVASQLAILAAVQLRYPEMLRYGEAAVDGGAAEGWVGAFAWFARSIGKALAGRAGEALADLARSGAPGEAGRGGLDGLVARGMIRLWSDDRAGAWADLSSAVERATRGEPLRVAQALGYLGETAYRLGRLEEAVLYAELAVAGATDAGRVWDLPILHALAAYPRAARGDLPEAEAHAAASREWSELVGTAAGRAYAAAARAAVADVRGDAPGFLAAAADLEAAYDSKEPGTHLLGPARADGLARVGRLEEAAEALSGFEAASSGPGRRSAAMAAARVRAALAAARGDWREASAASGEALSVAEALCMPLEAARVHWGFGRAALACRRRAEAASHFEAARDGFEATGAYGYLEAVGATAEAAGLAGRARGRSGLALLSPTEAAVARLVAAGLSNREVAARLHMSPKTVEHHLSHIYARLGLSSRRQLAERLGPGA